MDLQSLITEETRRVVNEIFQRPNNGILELGKKAYNKKKKYAKKAWELIKRCYSYIGGCQSFDDTDGDGGFSDFITGKYIWRLYFGDSPQDILGIMVYKPTPYGRKRIVSAATNKSVYQELLNNDFVKSNHTYAEVSGKSEHQIRKDPRTSWIPKEKASQILAPKKIDLDADDEINRDEFDPYDSFSHYYRVIGNGKHRKAMFGYPIKR